MALATTCPQCKTSFKVVPDQLKLRRGLVRCGVCQHVFSGVEHLRYVDKDEKTEKATPSAAGPDRASAATQALPEQTAAGASSTPASTPAEAAHSASASPTAASALTDDPDAAAQAEAAEGVRRMAEAARMFRELDGPPADADTDEQEGSVSRDTGSASDREVSANAAPAASQGNDDELHTQFFMADHESDDPAADASRLPASLRNAGGSAQASDPLEPDTLAAGALISEANKVWRQQQPRQSEATESDAGADASARPQRPKRSRRKAAGAQASGEATADASTTPSDEAGASKLGRWLTPTRSRRLCIALAVLAVIQLLAVFRSEIAYHLPFLRPLASMASTLTGQSIEPPMKLSTLAIESFELSSTNRPGQTRLTAILRNRGDLPARWPAMELTLKSPSRDVLVRKVLMPGHYLPASQSIQDGIPAHFEQPLDLILDTGELNLAGYEVKLFYP